MAILLVCIATLAYPQANLPTVVPPSPNAANLGLYGQIPVSFFSGLPQISIPLGNVTAGDISVPITLNYHGGGVHPEHHPGWVGLGWDLNAGGVITRKVNGGVDEILAYGFSPETIFGYYYNYGSADYATWASADTLAYYANRFGISHAYPAPDEFIFNFGGYSGSFFYNQKGKWQVRSSDPINLKVEEQLMDNYTLARQARGDRDMVLRRIFYKFTLTTPDGTKYVFGGSPTTVEFTRSSVNQSTTDLYNTSIIATSWYLSSIVSRKGQRVDLTYENDAIQLTQATNVSRYQYKEGSASSQDFADIDAKGYSVVNPCYLAGIKTPSQKVTFSRSVSTELTYNFNPPSNTTVIYPDLSESGAFTDIKDEAKWFKLDSISFYADSTGFRNKYSFVYNNISTKRLMLQSVQQTGVGGLSVPPYQFGYDTTSLPDYNARKIDHWGFYNGHDYFKEVVKTPSSSYNTTDLPAYFTSRNPNASLMQAGTLTSIKYPTGGTSAFTYEPHAFGKVAKRFPFVVTDSAGMAGGLRIKTITNTDDRGNVAGSKQYLYVKNYNTGGSTSSGILGSMPQYLDQGQWTLPGGVITYWFWYDFSIAPLSFTDGNHVTYNEVVEKLQDGSYTVYSYSNHDVQTYRDTTPVAGLYTAPSQWKMDPNTSKALERGKLLTKSDYNAANVLLHKVKYDYDTSGSRLSDAVRMINLTSRNFGDAYDSRATAYLTYTFPRYLIRESDSTWDQTGANPVVKIRNTLFNTTYRQKTQDSTINSMGGGERITYQYPFDMSASADLGIYKKMADSNMIAPPIITRKFVSNTQTTYSNMHYYEPFTGIYVPQSVEAQNGSNPAETRLRYQAYDNRGNILSVSKEGDYPISYLWNFAQSLPVAEVKNAMQADIAYTSFEGDSKGSWNAYTGVVTAASLNDLPPTGRKYYNLTPSSALTKTGLTASLSYVVSYWTRNAAAFAITGTQSGYPLQGKTINGWTYFEHLVTGQTSISISGTGVLDEVRLYPNTAQMTTYAYDPLTELTNVCATDSKISNYEYDGLGRLALVRDQDRNVVKKIKYKYYNQPSDGEYGNAQMSFTATKSGCPLGQEGSAVTYLVEDNKYISTISQAYVDSLALAEGNANKQSNANAKGVCTRIPETVTISGYSGGQVIVYFRSATETYHIQAGGGNTPITIPWDTYTITCEVKSGDKITFSLNGVLQTDSFVTYSNVDIHAATSILIGVYGNTPQSIVKQRNNCLPTELPSSVTYPVPANTYVSTISQTDANTQAIAVSQTAAQNYANLHGTCTAVPTTTSISYTNNLSKKVTLTLTNTATGTVYTFTLNITNTPTTAGSVPTGTYNVVMHADGASDYYQINSYIEDADDTDLNMTNIPLNTATTTVSAHH